MTEIENPAGRPERRTPERWAKLVQDYERSGQSQRAFCAERGIGQSSLRYWRRRLEQGYETEDGSTPRRTRLIPVKLVEEAVGSAGSGVALISRRGIRVEIARGFDAATLARVLASLEAA